MPQASNATKVKVFHNILTDIQTAKLTKIDTYRKFQTLFGKKDPMLSPLFMVIEKRTVEYGKFFETISLQSFTDYTDISRRKVQYLINELLEKGLIVRATSTVEGYKCTYAYSFNWLALTDDLAVKAAFLKEYNRVGKFTSLSKIEEKRGAPDALISEKGCTRCTLNNNNHKINNNNHSLNYEPSDEGRSLVIVGGSDMDFKESLLKAEATYKKSLEKKVAKQKTRNTVSRSGVESCMKQAMSEYWPDSKIPPYSDLNLDKVGAMLRRNYCSNGVFDAEGAYTFLNWSIQNWAIISTAASRWWGQHNVSGVEVAKISPVPDIVQFIPLFKTAYRIYNNGVFEEEVSSVIASMDLDPVAREEEKLRRLGHKEEDIKHIISRRRKHLEREDRYSAIRKQSKQWTEAMQTAANSMYSTYARSAKNAIALAASANATIAPENLKMPMLGDTVTGPDGNEYPVEVMVHFIPAPWDDDPAVMQENQDKAFFKAVEDFNSNKLFGGDNGSDE